ncbi:NAD(P)-dependent oxidoreductase [Pedobacter sp. SYSU D00535]|uniref:NAD(P)-dependent oxidoreductase n=1 Tax=Pedobacter sp. SYSU D00535 TaxID=2810308 RepID=UPI001A96FEF5|nr:SDR family oxidoreductase [Pedobacter sp. SYSU D00535]
MKKIIVFGASRGTGKQVVEQALALGLEVKAMVRNIENFTLQHPNLKTIKNDVLRPETFQEHIAGNEVVISCLGIPKIQPTTLYSQGMKNIVDSMQHAGVSRIICISSGAISIPPKSSFIMTFLIKNVLQRIYKPIYTDMVLMENILSQSELNWTVVRAPKLSDGKLTKKYRIITQQPLKGIPTISRADLAHYILDHITDSHTFKSKVEIAY